MAHASRQRIRLLVVSDFRTLWESSSVIVTCNANAIKHDSLTLAVNRHIIIIESLKNNNTNEKKSKTLKSEGTSPVSQKDSSFLEILEQIVPSTREETREINVLWQKLPDVERNFLQEPNRKNLETYKELVKDITNAIIKSNTSLVQARQRGRMDKKVLMTVKVIDENIQLLAMTMLNPANSAFGLLKQIERIRGLLLDLNK
jgi:uncharacterized protein YaaR (DUF327 family)